MSLSVIVTFFERYRDATPMSLKAILFFVINIEPELVLLTPYAVTPSALLPISVPVLLVPR